LKTLRLLKERCDLFCCLSQSTAQDLQAQLQMPHGRMRIVHGAPTGDVRNAVNMASSNSPTFLFVGDPGYHRNVTGVLCALSAARQVLNADVRLIMASDVEAAMQADIRSLANACALPAEAIRFVPSSESHLHYNCAVALLNPSLWEGTALAILDAMAAGLPVIAGDNSAQSEVCDDGALLVNAEDMEDIARGLITLVQDSVLRQDLASKAVAQANRFTWRRSAEKTAVYLAECVSRRGQYRPAAEFRADGEPVTL
jgi:glycosyltransferase involved in cell wall biosynthesis